ncbi:hypothetical protein H8693_00620 [Christensenellaceae bacterium NSJ-63]|uniref:Uncharacterized protein n=1 Tax=Guopingia tenuis TaxID=2763656 RepID=A0A926DI04_9FIRM|nr:hypothetical protein [Guopingia tenuis]MBC8537435.1 hypothetical protein [Guopingia tenuis]
MAKRRISLKMSSPREVRRTLARIANMTINGEIESKTANTIILACNAVLGSIRADEQQRQIDEIQSKLDEWKG